MPFEYDNETQNNNNKNNDEPSEAIRKLRTKLSKFETIQGRLHGLDGGYIPRPNDIVISTSPKCGTTWMQQICHQIRSYPNVPNMYYNEISEVVPWIELAYDIGQDLNSSQYTTTNCCSCSNDNDHDQAEDPDKTKPRLFKTHAWAKHCPKFKKTIVVVRNPYDVCVSFFNFFQGWFFEYNEITLHEFIYEFWLARGIPDDTKLQNASYFVHLISWYECKFFNNNNINNNNSNNNNNNNNNNTASNTTTKKDNDSTTAHIQQSNDINFNDPNILFVCYEDLKENLVDEIKRIALFMMSSTTTTNTTTVMNNNNSINKKDSVLVNDTMVQEIAKYCTFEYMKQNELKFNESITKRKRNEACGLSKDAGFTNPTSTTCGTNNNYNYNDNYHNSNINNSKVVQNGPIGYGKQYLSIDIQQAIEDKWKHIVEPVTGCSTYEELRLKLKTMQ